MEIIYPYGAGGSSAVILARGYDEDDTVISCTGGGGNTTVLNACLATQLGKRLRFVGKVTLKHATAANNLVYVFARLRVGANSQVFAKTEVEMNPTPTAGTFIQSVALVGEIDSVPANLVDAAACVEVRVSPSGLAVDCYYRYGYSTLLDI